MAVEYDEIGICSEVKLAIVREYAAAYSKIMEAWRRDEIGRFGQSKSIEVFVNFMIMDINRNALRRNPSKSIKSKVDQMTRLWGDDSWLDAGYDQVPTLFDEDMPVKVSNERFAEAFRQRLIKKAGFKHVPKPMPMRTVVGPQNLDRKRAFS